MGNDEEQQTWIIRSFAFLGNKAMSRSMHIATHKLEFVGLATTIVLIVFYEH